MLNRGYLLLEALPLEAISGLEGNKVTVGNSN
jgi:hypothetical protein